MPLRRSAIILFTVLLCCVFGCTPKPEMKKSEEAGSFTPPSNQAAAAAPDRSRQAPQLIGFILHDDGREKSALLMHGFLHMAENIGYPAKLYRAQAGAETENAVDTAIKEECKGLLIQNENGTNDQAVKKAVEAGIKVIVPYDRCSLDGISANVIADDNEYTEEIARCIATRMIERSLKSGRILVYTDDPSDALAASFHAALTQYYSQYTSLDFVRSAADETGAIAELSDYLLENRDIKGMFVTDASLVSIAVKARNDAQTRFRKDGAPTPSPAPKVDEAAGQTPTPTVAPGLLKQISITLFALGQSEENYKLLSDNELYGLCIEPYYDVAAQATMTLDQILSGDLVSKEARVNRPIVTESTIEKYTLIYEQAKTLFALVETGTE